MIKCLYRYWKERDVSVTARTSVLYRMYQYFTGHSSCYWPTHFSTVVNYPDRVLIGRGAHPGLSPGGYIQGANGIFIGDNVLVGPNVGLVSANHSITNFKDHDEAPPLIIHSNCWIGMGAVILPGVELLSNTIVAAGSVVTKSPSQGNVILAGSPAKVIREGIDTVENDKLSAYVGFHNVRNHRSISDLFISLGLGKELVDQYCELMKSEWI